MSKVTYTDEELVSFLDGVCSDELADAIGLALENDKALQKRLDSLDINKQALIDGFNGLLTQSPTPDIPKQAAQMPLQAANDNKMASRPLMRFAALLLAGVIGYSASFLLPYQPPQPEPKKIGWIGMVVNYQQLYTKNTLAHLSPSDTDIRAGLKHVSDKLGKELNFDAATSRSDLSLRQTNILAFNGKPLVQLAYQSAGGAPLSLCVIKSNKPGDAPPNYKQAKNMQMAVWRKGGYAYLLIGGQDKELIKSAAEDLSKNL